MTGPCNIATAFAEIAREYPDLDAIIAEDITLTYAKLWRIVERFAVRMQAIGIGRGSVVGIDTTDMIVSTASIFALSLRGAAYILVDRDFVVGRRQGITHFLRSPERQGIAGLPYVVMDETWSPKFASSDDPLPDGSGFADPGDTCWILASSGTTGRPKFVSIDQATVWKRVSVVKSDYGTGKTRLLLLFGCNTRPFGIRAVAALLSGNAIIDSHSLPFLRRHGVNLVCGSPAQFSEWLTGKPISPPIDRLQVSGARLDDSTLNLLLQNFAVVEDVYGASETIAAHVNVMRKSGDGITCLGHTVESEVEIVDANDLAVPDGQNGALRIRNAHMARGYDGLPDETARRFRNGWFYPGDLATWEAGRVLRVIGRDDDVANLGGRKFNLGDFDAALSNSAEVAVACTFPDPRGVGPLRLAACLRLQPGADVSASVRAAFESCARTFGAAVSPKTILVVDDLALTQDGVPRRRQAQEQFADTVEGNDLMQLDRTLFTFKAMPDAR